MDERDELERNELLWAWLRQLPIEIDSRILRVDIKPLNDRACQVLRTYTLENNYEKDCFTADSRSAPAFQSVVLIPDIEAIKCSISVLYKDGRKADFGARLSDFY